MPSTTLRWRQYFNLLGSNSEQSFSLQLLGLPRRGVSAEVTRYWNWSGSHRFVHYGNTSRIKDSSCWWTREILRYLCNLWIGGPYPTYSSLDTILLRKVGRMIPQLIDRLREMDLLHRATYVAYGTTDQQVVVTNLETIHCDKCEYYSMVMISIRRRRVVLRIGVVKWALLEWAKRNVIYVTAKHGIEIALLNMRICMYRLVYIRWHHREQSHLLCPWSSRPNDRSFNHKHESRSYNYNCGRPGTVFNLCPKRSCRERKFLYKGDVMNS